LQQYADMPRRDDVNAITFSSAADFLKTLGEYRTRKLLPSSMPKSQPGARGAGVASWYGFADYQDAYTKRVPSGETNACGSGVDRRLLIIEGTGETNIVKCSHGNQLYFMREGDDHVDDSWDDDIIYGGPGNDILDAGWGNDLLFFNYGWGQDTVRKTCHSSSYVPQDSINSANVYWAPDWPYKNFIVFGKDVRREDIVSVNDKLVHKVTGDSISIDGNCFNVVYWP
jgi:Ca2+-binding RTX toxin-like protein